MAKKKYTPKSFFKFERVKNLIKKQPVPTDKKDTSQGITTWGHGSENNFPQQLLQNVQNSPIASAAVELWHEFTEGEGFAEERLNGIQINKTQNMGDLHSVVSSDFSSMWGMAVLVSYNLVGEKASFKHLPFESTRLGILNDEGIADKILYNPYFGTADYQKKYTKYYYTYNPDPQFVLEEIANHKKLKEENKVDYPYPGQVFWYSIETPLHRVYPQVFYYPTTNWMQLDRQIQLFHNRNIQNNFLLSVLINKFGDPDADSGERHEDGSYSSTVGQDFDETMETFSGAGEGGGAMVDWFTNKEEQTTISPFPSNTNDNLFTTLQGLVTDQLAIGFKTPRVLLNIGEAGKLGDAKDLLNAVKVMQGRVKKLQHQLERNYAIIFDGFQELTKDTDYSIKAANPVDVLPDWAIAAFTPDELRKYVNDNFNVELNLEFTPEPTQENG